MIRFMGQSLHTHWIKNKPIEEGFKFFVLTTKTWFIFIFTPNGRTASKENTQEYSTDDEQIGKIESMMLHITSIIDILLSNTKAESKALQDRTEKKK